MIKADHLTKRYGAVEALRGVSLDVGRGELFGLIGPDGAGKSTLIRILCTLLLPDGGTAQVCGHDVVSGLRDIRPQIGYMPGTFALYPDLTIEENLHFFATLFGTTVEANYDLVRDIYSQIEPFKHRRAGKLSGGMKQKLALSCALIHKPAVIFLDEPSTGVDPTSRRELWDMLTKLKGEGITLLVSTPYMDEAVRCDRVALMREGEVLVTDSPQRLIAAYPQRLYGVRAADTYAALRALRSLPEVKSCFAFGDSLHLTLHDEAALARVQAAVPADYAEIAPSIEDYYMTF